MRTRRKRRAGTKFATVSLPTPLIEEIERLIVELRYWPTKTDFIREAVVEKLERFRKKKPQEKRKCSRASRAVEQ
ncbi:MAG: ribbon-helix-helix domain-containing protein [Candidatus Norongarragalinales archaeon]